jgi:hypothetical protein
LISLVFKLAVVCQPANVGQKRGEVGNEFANLLMRIHTGS